MFFEMHSGSSVCAMAARGDAASEGSYEADSFQSESEHSSVDVTESACAFILKCF